ncbi:hypothetical protein EW026_g1527 [Hermanssonia centrifuga]|uniref:BSD domain-containing protein n=1 Tax=Hermanssonia centrifuga TaxID=98765 RepID=A0A4S4KVU8_9APHY|nr:hypothetical protein EW026_g1527 [Hermanssonia centrifuga]
MNFLDTYDVSGTSTPREGPEPTLNEEVTQVVGQLSRFWGGFRKQSQTVFETARKDLGQVVSQAQKELTKLTAETPAETSAAGTTPNEADDIPATTDESTDVEAGPSGESSTTPSEEGSTITPGSSHNRGTSVSATAQNLFTRLQTSLPANLASTVQAQIPESFRQGTGSIDLAQLRTTLASEFQRVQGITRAQAEEYVHKSEELLREAGEFLKDAVKVVPPTEEGYTPGVMWDGTDVWLLPEMGSSGTADVKGKERQERSGEGIGAVATRAAALLKQLRHDPEVIRRDPESEANTGDLWKEWVSAYVDAKEDGINNEEWKDAIEKALADLADGSALQNTIDVLVPEAMTSETFWTRYFFRVYQVEQEEERRKAILQGTTESEEDFEWESDDEETTASKIPPSSAAEASEPSAQTVADSPSHSVEASTSRETLTASKASVVSTPATGSPRHSSEDSYDVVSSQVSNNGESKSESEPGQETRRKAKTGNDEDGDDSDWE